MDRFGAHRVATALAAFIAICAIALPFSSPAEVDGDRFRSAEWRVRMTAPKNWQISEQTSYPNVLLWMVRRNPRGKMLLSAEKQPDKTDSLEYATRTAKVLEALGFTVRQPQHHSATGAYWIDFDNCPAPDNGCEGKMFLRQAFLVANGNGYALTLSAPDARTRGKHLRAFDYALRSIRILRGSPPAQGKAGDSKTRAPKKQEPK